jgi:hypothetical protein
MGRRGKAGGKSGGKSGGWNGKKGKNTKHNREGVRAQQADQDYFFVPKQDGSTDDGTFDIDLAMWDFDQCDSKK